MGAFSGLTSIAHQPRTPLSIYLGRLWGTPHLSNTEHTFSLTLTHMSSDDGPRATLIRGAARAVGTLLHASRDDLPNDAVDCMGPFTERHKPMAWDVYWIQDELPLPEDLAEAIFDFLHVTSECLRLDSEAIVIAIVLLERLVMRIGRAVLRLSTTRPLLVTALVVASKSLGQDDINMHAFCEQVCCNDEHLRQLVECERAFTHGISFDDAVPPAVFEQYCLLLLSHGGRSALPPPLDVARNASFDRAFEHQCGLEADADAHQPDAKRRCVRVSAGSSRS